MIKSDRPEIPFNTRWQTVIALSFDGASDCEYEAIEKVAEILACTHVPESVLLEAKQAVARVIEKDMSGIETDQVHCTFTILVQTRLSEALETPVNEANGMESNLSKRGIGFFLTEKRTSETKSGNTMNQVVISIHIYHEDHLV